VMMTIEMAGRVAKISKAERLVVNEQMLVLLEWAAHHPKLWHDIGNDPATLKAACSRKRFLSQFDAERFNKASPRYNKFRACRSQQGSSLQAIFGPSEQSLFVRYQFVGAPSASRMAACDRFKRSCRRARDKILINSARYP
jgi:hypothetical protein